MIGFIRLDRNKITAHNPKLMPINGENECCIHRCVDQAHKVSLALCALFQYTTQHYEKEHPTGTNEIVYFLPPQETPA
jgi:hypothetical protein